MKRMLLVLCSFCCSMTFLHAQDGPSPSPIIFIYDASGSMWGQMEGKTKMQIAGKVLSEALDNLPEAQQIGLVAYGHRRKGDCRDVEFLVDMANTDKTEVRESLGNIKPLGKTPLAYSAEQVIDQLRTTGEKATIILVTDGIESCDGDLCEVVRKAKAEGIEFKLHVIGFGLKDGETEALKCAAGAGDGAYYDAANASSLEIGISEATVATIDTVQYLAPEKPIKTLSVYAIKNGEAIDAWVKAIPSNTEQKEQSVRTYADTGFISLTPGIYDLKFMPLGGSDVQPITLNQVEILADSMIHRTMSFDAGKVAITVTNNGEGWDTSVSILNKETGKSAARSRTYGRVDILEVNPGVYDLELQALQIKGLATKSLIENIEVKAGDTTQISHNFESGIISIGAKSNGALIDVAVTVKESNTKKYITGGRTYTAETSNPRQMIVSPGIYDVQVKGLREQKGKMEEFTIEVIAGETAERSVKF